MHEVAFSEDLFSSEGLELRWERPHDTGGQRATTRRCGPGRRCWCSAGTTTAASRANWLAEMEPLTTLQPSWERLPAPQDLSAP